jgi:adenylate kinase family enzyme
MQRVMIVGGPGSGKSTMARWIGAQTGLPVQHMDHIHWLPNWVERTTEEKLPLIIAVEATDRWIIEGGVSSRYSARLERADMLIWLDLPVGLRLWRVLRRSWRYRGQSRPDLPEGCLEQLNGETLNFLIWIWQNRNSSRRKIVDTVHANDGPAIIHHLRSRRAVKAFQKALIQS